MAARQHFIVDLSFIFLYYISMKKFLNRFYYKHPNFGIPNLMRYIAIANAIFWAVGLFSPSIISYLMFVPSLIMRGQVWRIISFIFIPANNGILGLIAVYFYFFIGSNLEARWGTARFNLYYFCGVLLTIITGFLFYFIAKVDFIITATYIYLSMFFSFAAMFPDAQVLLFFIIPIKMKWLAIVDAAFFVFEIFNLGWPYGILPFVAVLNFLLFCGSDLLEALHIRKKTPQTINFQKAAREIRREQAENLYNHKCSVCGRTDTQYPDLQFRYCSRCQGYHCFCEDHINNHTHFTQ